MLNIILPIAGRGSRFKVAGYQAPKPLIPVHGQPMIVVVINNIQPQRFHRFIFLVLQEHLDKTNIQQVLEDTCSNHIIIPVKEVTEGAACTVLLARHLIDSDDPLMIANTDQYVAININDYLAVSDQPDTDGLIMTFWANDPKWSFVKLNEFDLVTEVAEKSVISNEATVGIYNFKHGKHFVQAADRMISNNLRINNEFYVAPTYNSLINKGAKIRIFNIGIEGKGMHGLGTPEDLETFLKIDFKDKKLPD